MTQPETESVLAHLDMLMVDRLRAWAHNIHTHGADIRQWGDPMFVGMEMNRIAADIEAAVKIGGRMGDELSALRAECERLRAERDDYRQRKDDAYEERNRVVAALARLFPSGVARTNIPGWDEEWHGCVYIDLPTGQVSWHFHDSQAHLFAALPPYPGSWDGHDTPEKYRRLGRLTGASVQALRKALESYRWTSRHDWSVCLACGLQEETPERHEPWCPIWKALQVAGGEAATQEGKP